MKKLYLFLFFFLVSQAHAATVIFKMDYESPMSLKAAGTYNQYWTAGEYGEDGVVNSLGYNVPWGFPGKCEGDNTCAGSDNTYVPHFNFNSDSDGNNYAELTTEDKVNGSYSMKLVQGATGRVQHITYKASAGDPWDRLVRGLIKDWIKFDDLDLPATKWHSIFEIRGTGSLYNNKIMFNYKDGNTIYVRYQYQDSTHGIYNFQTAEIDPADYENKWLEIIIAWEFGNPGYFLFKIKPAGEAETTIINFAGDNSQIDAYNIHYPKSYGYNFIQWHDDTAFYSNTGVDDLPAWDSGAPSLTISGSYPTGNPTISCSANPRPVTLSWLTSNTANCRIDSADPGSYAAATADSVTNTDSTSHSVTSSFACGASYTRYVYCQDNYSQTAGPETLTWTIETEETPTTPPTGLTATGVGGGGFGTN